MDLVEELVKVYEQEEWWHKKRLSHEEAVEYHSKIIRDGNCITVCDGNILVSYCEFFKAHGVCYVKNLWVRENYRLGRAIQQMKKRLFEVCKDCKIFLGERQKHGGIIEFKMRG
jgi:hypothetical protein